MKYDVVIARNGDNYTEIAGTQVYHAGLGTTVTVPESCGEIDMEDDASEAQAIAAAVDHAKSQGMKVIDEAPHEVGEGVPWDEMVRTADKQFPERYVIVHVDDIA